MPAIRLFTARRCAVATLSLFVFSTFDHSFAVADDSQPSPSIDLPPVVVSATRVPTPEDQIGSSVTVITADEIAQKQARTLPDVLAEVPGMNVVQTGGPGGTTSVYMRGTNPNHTKVLIDGIDVGDPSSIDGSFDFSQILASDIERVEILRGPQSGLYGSDAIGGVIDIVTKKGSGPAQFTGTVEGGSFGTFNQTAAVSGSIARFNYAASFNHNYSGDSNVTPPNLVPAGRSLNPDTYDNKTYATKLGAALADNLDVGLVVRSVNTSLEGTSDDGTGPETMRSTTDSPGAVHAWQGSLVAVRRRVRSNRWAGLHRLSPALRRPQPGDHRLRQRPQPLQRRPDQGGLAGQYQGCDGRDRDTRRRASGRLHQRQHACHCRNDQQCRFRRASVGAG